MTPKHMSLLAFTIDMLKGPLDECHISVSMSVFDFCPCVFWLCGFTEVKYENEYLCVFLKR